MPDDIIGRESELEAAAHFLTELEHGPAALVFAGEPGIGKTAVWQEAVDRARASSVVVLSARPDKAEMGLGFAGLADLLDPVADRLMPGLPEPQRRALAVALLREDPGAGRTDPRAVAAATTGVLRELARRGPVVVAVDDLQWLDRPSARVLGFAARRVIGLPIGVLASERVEHGLSLPLALERAWPAGRLRRVELGPLGVAALHQLLNGRLGRSFTRRIVVRIEEATGGNPFFALEVARSLPQDALTSHAALPVPEQLLELVEASALALPEHARRALLAVTSLRVPTLETVMAATGGTASRARRSLDQAEAQGIIMVDSSVVRFTHPLFAGAVYALASAVERRAMHRRLAELTSETEEQAQHLALGADGPDAGLAASLDAAAEHARARGAPESAAELVEWALTLTPAGLVADSRRRTIRAAEYHFHAGELRRAREMLEGVVSQPSPGPDRACALHLLGEIHYHENSFGDAIRVLHDALEQAGDNGRLRLAIELSLTFGAVSRGDFAGVLEHAGQALALAELVADPASEAEALAVAAIAEFLGGRGLDHVKIERALQLEDPSHPVPALMSPSLIAGHLALYEGRLAACDRLLLPLRARFAERGEESDLAWVSWHLIWSAAWQGDLQRAEAYATEMLDCAERIDSDSQRCMALAYAAVVSAYAGDAALAESRAEESIALASRTGYDLALLWANWALGLLALCGGDPHAADAALGPLAAMFEDHVPEPIRAFFLPDQIEALIGLGDLQQAEHLLTVFGEAARRLERPWALMLAERCRALLLAARGDLHQAAKAVREALAVGENLELRLEVARTLLVAGQIERRCRRKQTARGLLGQAAEIFSDAGARLWARRAQLELDRAAARPGGGGLTASEQAVAQLVASGLTNREIARRLFMSPKTVEVTLARVYRKLGIRSRAQLGSLIGAASRAAKT